MLLVFKITGTLIFTLLLASCQTSAPDKPVNPKQPLTERITVYQFEKLVYPPNKTPLHDQVTVTPIQAPPQPAQIDTPPTLSPADRIVRMQGEITCPMFQLPQPQRLPPLPVLTAEQRADPNKAAVVMVNALQEMRSHVRNLIATNEKAYLKYRADCKAP